MDADKGGQLGGPSSGVPDTADSWHSSSAFHKTRKWPPRLSSLRLFVQFLVSFAIVAPSAGSVAPAGDVSSSDCSPDHFVCRAGPCPGKHLHDPAVLCGFPSTADSEDCAVPSPGSLPAISNVSQYIRPDLAVAPTAVLDPGNLGLLGSHVHANPLSHHLGIFRRSLAVPHWWLSHSFLLDSPPDSGPTDVTAAIGSFGLGRPSPDLWSPVLSSSSYFE